MRNAVDHFKNVKNPEVKARQRRSCIGHKATMTFYVDLIVVSVWACVDQDLSNQIAAAVGHAPVKPLKVKLVSEAPPFHGHIGFVPLVGSLRSTNEVFF